MHLLCCSPDLVKGPSTCLPLSPAATRVWCTRFSFVLHVKSHMTMLLSTNPSVPMRLVPCSPDLALGKGPRLPLTPDVKLWHRAVVVHQENSLRGLVRQLSIDSLDNEGRRVAISGENGVMERSPLFSRSMSAPVGVGCWVPLCKWYLCAGMDVGVGILGSMRWNWGAMLITLGYKVVTT